MTRSASERGGLVPPRSARPLSVLYLICALGLIGFAGFAALGIWQLQRLGWKLALIDRIETRVHATPVAPPGRDRWPLIGEDEYLRLRLTGRYLHDRETLVQAVTERGGGFWVLTPLRTDSGFTVLVNRGFVPPERREPASRLQARAEGDVTVTGLLRLSEPAGGFLRSNDAEDDRWYSRDVAIIARARGLGDTAPYFVDADDMPNPGGFPVGGLTLLRFPNNHLVYALTWFGLALMLGAATVFVIRGDLRLRRGMETEN